MPRENGEYDVNYLRRQLETALVANASLAKENEELRQEISRLKAQITALRAHSQERKSMLWKKLQNSNDHSIEKPTILLNLSTTEKHQQQSEQEPEKKENRPTKAPTPPPVPSRAPPPPPMPSKVLVDPRAVHRVPELMELYRSLTRQDAGPETKPGQAGKGPAVALTKNMIGEIENRSTYISAVRSEVETRAEFINLLIKEVECSAHEKISEVEAFVGWVDEQLSGLVDERAVLRHFPHWPERKADTLREAAFCYRDLASLNCEVSSFEDNPRESLAQAARRVQDLQDRLERSVSNVERTREGTSKRYRDFKIPWDWMTNSGLIGEMKLNSLRLARDYMKRVTRELKLTREEDNLLLQGVRFAHRVHQFAGGFDVQTTQTFQELKRVGLGYATK